MKESMHRDTPFVSVVIDSYNYGHYVEQAIESALGQDFPHAQREILVVDDGSTDDTAERLKKYGDAIRYLQKPNGGQASAFNFEFAHARACIIAPSRTAWRCGPPSLRKFARGWKKISATPIPGT